MWHIIIQVRYDHGGTRLFRETSDTADIEYWEKYHMGDYYNNHIRDATVINAFFIPKGEE